jgi:hypothetical protein
LKRRKVDNRERGEEYRKQKNIKGGKDEGFKRRTNTRFEEKN